METLRSSKEQLVSQFGNNIETACRAVFINSRIIAYALSELHITVDCKPVLDLATTGGDQVIGDRAYGELPPQVAEFGRAACSGLLKEIIIKNSPLVNLEPEI